ncbi:MAG: barstar family protein [Clostridia bacterium]|nr:barstar family protein [Clostridia bacterium]
MEILIDCEKLRSRRVFNDYLEAVMDLPAYFGRNLDALYDVLSTVNGGAPCHFRIINREKESSRMVGHYNTFLQMLEDVHDFNPNVTYSIEPSQEKQEKE